jgi:glycosyltransferase involved in cell wall biosynthesis
MGLTIIKQGHSFIILSGLHPLWLFVFSFLICSIRTLTRGEKILVIDLHGSVFHEYANFGWFLKAKICFFLEFLGLHLADILIVASQELAHFATRTFKIPHNKITVLGNGTELPSEVSIDDSEVKRLEESLRLEGKKVLVMVAPRTSFSNILAVKQAQHVMRFLGKIRSDVVLFILGGGKVIEPVPDNVKYLGHVHDRLYGILLSKVADIAIAPYPLKAVCGGARNKILDYWSHKVMVISTWESMRGIAEAEPGVHFILSDYSAEGFAQAILRALEMDESEKAEIINEAYNLAKTRYLWKQKAQQLLSVIDRKLNVTKSKVENR